MTLLAFLHSTLTLAVAGGRWGDPVSSTMDTITTCLVAVGGGIATIGLIAALMFHSIGGHFGNSNRRS